MASHTLRVKNITKFFVFVFFSYLQSPQKALCVVAPPLTLTTSLSPSLPGSLCSSYDGLILVLRALLPYDPLKPKNLS